MANVAKITTPLAQMLDRQLVKQAVEVSPWDAASNTKRERALTQSNAVTFVLDRVDNGAFKTASAAVTGLLKMASVDPTNYAVLFTGRDGKLASRASLLGWVKKYQQGGVEALLCKSIGSKPKQHPWEARAVYLYGQAPTAANRPDAGGVAYQLEMEGFGKISTALVRKVINRYSKAQTEFSKKRVGAHYHAQNHTVHVLRDMSNMPVGHTYMGDGHMCDVYIASPHNGAQWRPELTVWIDWRSNYVAGWHISNAESAVSTLHSLASMFDHHRHIPARLYVDPGSGFKNKMISEGSDSFCERYSISPSFALPGNAKGKGLVEGWFKHFEFKCGKSFETYMGAHRTDRALANFSTKIKRGEIQLPSLVEYKQAIQDYVDWYNNNPQKRLGCSPADLWKKLERVDPVHSKERMVRPVYSATVSKNQMIQFKNRKYSAPALFHFTGELVKFDVDLNDDSKINVRDDNGKLICEAHLIERKHAVASSIIEDEQNKRLEGQIKRLDVHMKDKIEKARPVIAAQNYLDIDLINDSQNAVIEHDPDHHSNEVPFKIEDIFNA